MDCRIEARRRSKEKRESGKAEETFVESDCPCSVVVVAAVDYFAAAGTKHNSEIGGWQMRLAFLAGKGSREAVGRGVRG